MLIRALVIRDLFAQDEAMQEKNTQLNNADQHKSYYTRNSSPTHPPFVNHTTIRCVYHQAKGEGWIKKKKTTTKSEENL